MNKRIDFSFNGGFPATQFMTKFMQDSFREAFGAIASLIGDKVILQGVEEIGGQVTNGWICVGGELMPFTGGPLIAGVAIAITETPASRVFDDGNTNDVYFTKEAAFGTPGNFPYTDLKRVDTIKNLGVPKGVISMWSGAADAIPAGYALCDGLAGRPNLSGKFIVGFDPADADYDTIGKTGGEKKHTLTPAEQGSLDVAQKRDDVGGGTAVVTGTFKINGLTIPENGGANQSTYGSTQNIKLKNDAQAHESRPPYYTLAFIIKL